MNDAEHVRHRGRHGGWVEDENHSPLLLRLPRFFHFCQIYAGQLFVDQPIEVALQGATNKNFITLL